MCAPVRLAAESPDAAVCFSTRKKISNNTSSVSDCWSFIASASGFDSASSKSAATSSRLRFCRLLAFLLFLCFPGSAASYCSYV